MSYSLDLDEYPEKKLREELRNRRRARRKGLCDYCGRAPDTTPCKFPERHHAKPKKRMPLLKQFLAYLRSCGMPGVHVEVGARDERFLFKEFREERKTRA